MNAGPAESDERRRSIDDASAPLYSVGQVADFLDVQPAFLRRLDAEAVVSPARSAGNQRRYSRHQITAIQRVVLLVAEGLTLAGVRRLLELEQEIRRLQTELDSARAAGRDKPDLHR